MKYMNRARLEVGIGSIVCAVWMVLGVPGKTPPQPVRAFCVDFNWGEGGANGFAAPGLWADASPEEHVSWYGQLGANVIQSFAVSCNGYAWYLGGEVPPQPGLKHDFLPALVKLGHERGMQVMGYFCVAANTRWGREHPDLSYGVPSGYHIPLTDDYLDYLSRAIEEALRLSKMDGFMVDWLWNPSREARQAATGGQWLPAEKQLYETLMARPFPSDGNLTDADRLAYERKALDRCWRRIHDTARQVSPGCVIWLSCNKVSDPSLQETSILREVDWMMDESGTPEAMHRITPLLGSRTQQLLCLVGWGDGHDARGILSETASGKYGIYGFNKPNPDSLPLPVSRYLAQPLAEFHGNDRNIAVLARFFNHEPLDFVLPPLLDSHYHWEGHSDLDEMIRLNRARAIRLGVTGEGGKDWGLKDDVTLEEYLGRLQGKDVLTGLQVYGLDWPSRYSPGTLAKLDYIAADALLFPDKGGHNIALWGDGVSFPDPEDFMDRYVEYNVQVLQSPINIWSNPTFLPVSLQSRYDQLWTRERMLTVIRAAARNHVAVELNSKYEIPSAAFIRLAREEGCRFCMGSNRHDLEPGDLAYSIRMYTQCQLKPEDLYYPAGVRIKGEGRR
jgi:hypothetical protein